MLLLLRNKLSLNPSILIFKDLIIFFLKANNPSLQFTKKIIFSILGTRILVNIKLQSKPK